jgi:hypothetical protein
MSAIKGVAPGLMQMGNPLYCYRDYRHIGFERNTRHAAPSTPQRHPAVARSFRKHAKYKPFPQEIHTVFECGRIAGAPVDRKCAYPMQKPSHQGMDVEQLPLGHVIHLARRRVSQNKAVQAARMIAG